MSGVCNGLRLNRMLSAVALGVSACTPDESTTEPSASGGVGSAVSAATAPLSFRQVSAGSDANHACGLTTTGIAYCWGFGYLGNDGSRQLSLTPVAVEGGRQYRNISVGYDHTCAVATDNRAYCWGWNLHGQTGNGTRTSFGVPVPVEGGLRFRQVSAGHAHSCGVTTDDRAFCWGRNSDQGLGGQLGDGTTMNRLLPVAVTGGHRFREVSAGTVHTCGVRINDDLAYCWGNNRLGRLGNGLTSLQRLNPYPVAGGRRYRQVSAGYDHTCAVTIHDKGFCWGNGSSGQIGDGKTHQRWTPREVANGIAFSRLATGRSHTCGKTPNSVAYCWGANTEGAVGDGTTTSRLRPVAVSGPRFSQVSAGWLFSCGVTPASAAYCWGYNTSGSLGDGTQVGRLRPAAVVGPL